MQRPPLNEVDPELLPAPFGSGPICPMVTVSPGQWDALHQDASERGWFILEVVEHEDEIVVLRAYKGVTH